MAKTKKDIALLKESSCDIGEGLPFLSYDNQYQCYIDALFDSYIGKLDGIARIKDELNSWDDESKNILMFDLIEVIRRNYGRDFDEQTFLEEIFSQDSF